MKDNDEVTFDIPGYKDYKVVCKFGYNYYTPLNWWLFILKKEEHNFGFLFKKKKEKWTVKHKCWLTGRISTKEHLEKEAIKFFNERIVYPEDVKREAQKILNGSNIQ